MATIVAQATGNWSAGATWVGGVKPGVGDTAQTDAYVVTIDEDVECTALEATSTGYYSVTAARTITANVIASGSATYGLAISHAAGTVAIIGDISSPGTGKGIGITGNGNVTIGGGVAGSTAYNTQTVYKAGTGTLSVTGNLTGGAGTLTAAVGMFAGTLTITGNVTGGSGASNSNGLRFYSHGTVWTVTGVVTAGNSLAIDCSFIVSTGNIYGSIIAVGSLAAVNAENGTGSYTLHGDAYASATGYWPAKGNWRFDSADFSLWLLPSAGGDFVELTAGGGGMLAANKRGGKQT